MLRRGGLLLALAALVSAQDAKAGAPNAILTQAVAPTNALKRRAATETRTFSWDVIYWMSDEFFRRRHFQFLQWLSH